ncbi:MAG TPA: HEAT repeat domain-containing protein [Planctomycetota bacterium]|nr:HEAT repeat domain-containing protein [Planctomycetota bacterium]
MTASAAAPSPRRLALAVGLLCAALAAGCGPHRGACAPGPGPGRPAGQTAPVIPPVPAGARLVSFDAGRESATAGAFLEPAWCVQLTARVCGADGRPLAGAPVRFALDRRTGCGRILPAALADEWVLTDASGDARTLLVSSDRPERCRVWAGCGPASLGAEVEFVRGGAAEPAVAAGSAGGPGAERPAAPASPSADLDARVARLLDDLGRGGAAAERAGAEIAAMGRAALAPLLVAVYDGRSSPARRELAARALALVRDELVLGELLAALDDPRPAVRAGAESALVERGPARCAAGVLARLGTAGRLGRASALRVLSAWGRAEDAAALAAAASGDADPLVRATAAWRLRPLAERPEAFAALAAALGDRSRFVRYTAAKALGLVPAGAARAAALESLRGLADPDAAVRAAAARAARSPDCAGRHLALLADEDERVRRAAAESLGALSAGRPELLDRLERLTADPDGEVRELASRALVACGGRRESARMLRALSATDPESRAAALGSLERVYLVEFGRPGLGGVTAERLAADWARWVRDCGPLADRACLERAADAAGSRLRGEALLALAEAARAEGLKPVAAWAASAEKLSADPDPAVRSPAAAALHLLGVRRGLGVVLIDLASAEWPARYAACRAAAHLGAAEVGPALAERLADDSAAIRAEAHRSLCRLAGRDLGFDPEAGREARAAQQERWAEWARTSGRANP